MSAAVSRTPDARNARLTVTTEAGRQWAEQRLPVGPRQVPTSVTLEVNPGTQFQTVMGFGGAITQVHVIGCGCSHFPLPISHRKSSKGVQII